MNEGTFLVDFEVKTWKYQVLSIKVVWKSKHENVPKSVGMWIEKKCKKPIRSPDIRLKGQKILAWRIRKY